MSFSAYDAKRVVSVKFNIPKNLLTAGVADDSDYWYVTEKPDDGDMLIGGPVFIVRRDGAIFESTSCLSPHDCIEEAKANLKPKL